MFGISIRLLVFLILTGCNTLPQRDLQEVGTKLPDQWGGEHAINHPVPEQWVDAFDDD